MAASSKKRKSAPKATPGQGLNLVLTIVVILLAALWFHFHAKRSVGGWTYGGVTAIAAAAFAWGVWKSFAGDEIKTWPQRWLGWRHTRWIVAVLLVMVGAAHVLTGSLHVDLDAQRLREGEKLIAELRQGSRIVKTITLDAKHAQGTLTLPIWTAPVPLDVITRSPRGYEDSRVNVGRFVQSLTLPDAAHEKKYNLVRLSSGMFLFGLRNSAPDPSYDVDIYVNGAKARTLDALGFQTIYLGASSDDLRAILDLHGNERHRAELDGFLRVLDPQIPDAKRQEMIASWLADPVYLDTRELKANDSVRIVVKGYGQVAFDETIATAPRALLKTIFLKGVLPL